MNETSRELTKFTPYGFANIGNLVISPPPKKKKSKICRNGKLPNEILKEIFSLLLHHQAEPSLPLVCKSWKKNNDALMRYEPEFRRSRFFEFLQNVNTSNWPIKQTKILKEYQSESKLSASSHISFLKEFFYRIINHFPLNASEKASDTSEKVSGIMMESACELAGIVVDAKPLDSAQFILLLLSNNKFEEAFAYAFIIDIYIAEYRLKNKIKQELIEELVKKIGTEKTFKIMKKFDCSDYFFEKYIKIGCRDLKIFDIKNTSDLNSLENKPFIRLLFEHYKEQNLHKSGSANLKPFLLSQKSAKVILNTIIFPLLKQQLEDKEAIQTREQLIHAFFSVLPKNFQFENLVKGLCNNSI